DKWRIKGEPYLAGIDYKLIQEQAAALAAFSAQEIDTVALNNKLERDDLNQKHGKNITIDSVDSRSVWLVQPRGDGQWADPRVRQVIYLECDRKEMLNLMAFGEGKLSGPVPPAFGESLTAQEIETGYGKFDPAQAKQIIGQTTFDLSKEYS